MGCCGSRKVIRRYRPARRKKGKLVANPRIRKAKAKG